MKKLVYFVALLAMLLLGALTLTALASEEVCVPVPVEKESRAETIPVETPAPTQTPEETEAPEPGPELMAEEVSLTYEIQGGSAIITGYSGQASGSLVIPEEIGGFPVTEIDYQAFQGAPFSGRLVIPDSVTTLGTRAFADCTGLTELVLGKGILDLGEDTFAGCTGVSSIKYNAVQAADLYILDRIFEGAGTSAGGLDVVFGDSVKHIPEALFYEQENVTSLTIGTGVTSIGESAFAKCIGLTEIFYHAIRMEDLPYTNNVFRYPTVTGAPLTVVFGDEVEYIPANLFHLNDSLEHIVLGKHVEAIGEYAFANCTALEEVVFSGDALNSIGRSAFSFSGLTHLELPDSVTTLGESAFSFCENLVSVQLGDGLTQIAKKAFYCCYSLESIVIPDGVTTIGDSAFCDCGLRELTIGTGITTIEKFAFAFCEYLESIYWNAIHVDILDSSYLQINSGTAKADIELIFGDQVQVIPSGAFSGSRITSLKIGASVTEIGAYAFQGCDSLISIVIPDNVKKVGENAFKDCSYLTELSIGKGVSEVGQGAFSSCNRLKQINYNAKSLPDFAGDWDENLIFSEAGRDGSTLTVTIGNDVRRIPAYLFSNVTISTLALGPQVKEIGGYAFYRTGLTALDIPDCVETIEQMAFAQCRSLTELSLGVGITSIGEDAFLFASPDTVTYAGNEIQWATVSVNESGNACLSDPSKIIFLGASATPGTDGSSVVMHKGSFTGQVGSPLYVWVDLTAGNGENCQVMADGLAWSSTDESVFPVNAGDAWKDALVYDNVTGEAFCMVYPQVAGTATVTVTTPDGAFSSCTVVVELPTDSVTMDTSPYYIKEGASGTVYAQLTAKDGLTDKIWEWVSSDPSVVAFDLSGTGIVQGNVSVVGGGTLHSTSASIPIYALKTGEATVSCQFPDGSMSYRQVVVTAAEDGRDTIVSNYYDVPRYKSSSQEKEGRQHILEYRARWEEAYQGYIDAVGEALAEAEKESVSAREDSIEDQAKALRAADEDSGSKFLTFPAGFPGGWKDYAYQALCTVLLDAAEQKVDFDSISSADNFTVSSNIVKQIAKNMSSVQESFTYGGVEIEINMGNYFGLAFGSMTCTKTGLFTGHRSYTVTICSNMTSTNAVVADYLNEIKDLGYSAVANVYFAFAQDILGKPLSELTKPYLTRTLGKLAGRLDQYGLGKPYDVLMDCWQYYENWKSVYNKLNQIQPSAAQALLNAVNLDSQTADNPLVKKALKKVDQALRDLSDATLEYITEDGLVTPPEDEHSWFDRIFNFNCPVSVEVYGVDGTLLGQVDNNGTELTEAGKDRIVIDETGGAKQIYANEDLTFHLVGQGYGTMSCYVEEYDEAGTPVGRLNFYDIALEPRMELTASSTGTGKDSLTVTVNDEAIRPSEYIPVTDSARVTVEVATEKGGQVVGGGAYVRGDGVVLYALADEGYKFAGWFDSQGSPVSSNAVYEFTAREERALTARFVEQQPPSLTNYAPSLTEAYKGRCTVEAEQEGDTLRVTLNWIDQSASMPGFTALLARYRDNGQLEQLSVLTPQTQDKAVTFTGTVPEEGAALFLLDCDQCPVFEAYMSE